MQQEAEQKQNFFLLGGREKIKGVTADTARQEQCLAVVDHEILLM